jgi:hypothetical protein
MVASKDLKVALTVLDNLLEKDLSTLKKETKANIINLQDKLKARGQKLKSILNDQIIRLDNIIIDSMQIENALSPVQWGGKEKHEGKMFECRRAASELRLEVWRIKFDLLKNGQIESDYNFITSIPKRAPKIKEINWGKYAFDIACDAIGSVRYIGFIGYIVGPVRTTISTFFHDNANFKNSTSQVMNILSLLYFLNTMESQGISAVESLISKREREFEDIKLLINKWESFLNKIKEEAKNI